MNGREVGDGEFRSVMGFVDQEDTLMGTLTVYEGVLYSALPLRLVIITIEYYHDPVGHRDEKSVPQGRSTSPRY